MAEALDTYSDLDLSDSDGEGDFCKLNKQFKIAADHVVNLASTMDSTRLLQIYSFYKQANEGPCNTTRPKWYDMQAKQKWDAWNSLADMSPDTAKEKYIALVTECDPDWKLKLQEKGSSGKNNSQNWVTVSSLNSNRTEEESNDANKTIFDFCKDGDVWQVQTLLKTQPDLLNSLDSDGLGLIHWAADRGNLDVIKVLIALGCDISLRDQCGQTALHYSASCGHCDCVEFMLSQGIDKSIIDDDGKTAAELACDENVSKLLV